MIRSFLSAYTHSPPPTFLTIKWLAMPRRQIAPKSDAKLQLIFLIAKHFQIIFTVKATDERKHIALEKTNFKIDRANTSHPPNKYQKRKPISKEKTRRIKKRWPHLAS